VNSKDIYVHHGKTILLVLWRRLSLLSNEPKASMWTCEC